METGLINPLEANIQLQQVTSTKRQLTAKTKRIGKALLHVNQLLAFQKEGPEIQDWAESIQELAPNVDEDHIKLVLDLMKVGELEFDKGQGIQNIFSGVKETQVFYDNVRAENDFRKRRAEYITKSKEDPEKHKPFGKYIFARYLSLLAHEEERRFSLKIEKRKEAKESGKKPSGIKGKVAKKEKVAKKRFDFMDGQKPLKERFCLYMAIKYSFGHPSLTHERVMRYFLELGAYYPDFDPSIYNPVNPYRAWINREKHTLSLLFATNKIIERPSSMERIASKMVF